MREGDSSVSWIPMSEPAHERDTIRVHGKIKESIRYLQTISNSVDFYVFEDYIQALGVICGISAEIDGGIKVDEEINKEIRKIVRP